MAQLYLRTTDADLSLLETAQPCLHWLNGLPGPTPPLTPSKDSGVSVVGFGGSTKQPLGGEAKADGLEVLSGRRRLVVPKAYWIMVMLPLMRPRNRFVTAARFARNLERRGQVLCLRPWFQHSVGQYRYSPAM